MSLSLKYLLTLAPVWKQVTDSFELFSETTPTPHATKAADKGNDSCDLDRDPTMNEESRLQKKLSVGTAPHLLRPCTCAARLRPRHSASGSFVLKPFHLLAPQVPEEVTRN